MKFVLAILLLVLSASAFAQSPAHELLRRALAEFKTVPLPTLTHPGDTDEAVKIREHQNAIVALQKRAALIAELEQFLRDAGLGQRQRTIQPSQP